MPESVPPESSGGSHPLLQCTGLHLGYSGDTGFKAVVHDVSFDLKAGETVALVGESGSGKSTIAKALVKLIPVRSGSVRLDGHEVAALPARAFHPYRKQIQLVFQDPWEALNPRRSVAELLREPLQLHEPGLNTASRRNRIGQLLDSVHLPAELAARYPSELSGGQRQRVLLARALAVDPAILVCDEPVSALDVSIQAQLLQLLAELKETRGLTLLFISHDLAVVQEVADRVLVLQKGRAVEWQATGELFRNPRHPYTRMLIDACPTW